MLRTRRPDRPRAADLIRAAATDVVPLRAGAMTLALARIGAALALLPADRILAAQHAWLSPLAPEGAA